jgi:hypothetical protein
MTITSTSLTRAAGAAAVAAGLIFIGVQVNHPHLDLTTVASTEMAVRGTLKVVMTALAVAGITGMCLSQIRRNGVLGLIGYLLLSTGYLVIMSTTFAAAYVLPSVTGSDPSYVGDVLAVFTGGTATGDIGVLGTAFRIQSGCYLAGGLVLGIALFRARVLARWATALLAVGGVVTIALSVMPDAFYRLLGLRCSAPECSWATWRSAPVG